MFSNGEAPEVVDVDVSTLPLFLQREKALHNLHSNAFAEKMYDAGNDSGKNVLFAEQNSFIFSKSISRFRSFFPELLNKVELISQENEIRNLNNMLALPSASDAGGHTQGSKVIASNVSGVGSAKANLSVISTHNPVTTVNRIIFVDAASAATKDKVSKNRRKEDGIKERVNKFLQGYLGIAMTSANPDHMPVLVSELAWLELRGLSTVVSSGTAADVVSYLVSRPAIKRSLKLIVNELRDRASVTIDNASLSVAAGSGPQAASNSNASPDQYLHYAMLYSTKDDRFDLVSYTYSSVTVSSI